MKYINVTNFNIDIAIKAKLLFCKTLKNAF